MMALDGDDDRHHDAYDFDNECDDFGEEGEEHGGGGDAAAAAAAEGAEAAAAADTVAAAFEDHHFDSLEQQRQQQQQSRRGLQEQMQEEEQQQMRRANGRGETLMASLEARVAAAVAAAVGAAAAATRNNDGGGGGDTALRPRSASDGNVAAAAAAAAVSGGGGRGGNPPQPSSSATLLRRRANAAAATANNATAASASASARAARLAASSPAAVVRCLDPVNFCAPSPANARGVPGFSNGEGGGGGTTSRLVSPATLAAVGDCPSLSLHAPAEAGYVPLASWDLFDDAGMACAWGSSGTFVAAVAQCGTVACVDPRVGGRAVLRRNILSGSSPLASRSTSSSVVARWRTPGGGAARALKASPPGAATDLLLVTEHDSFAHLVDARRFDAAQTLEIGLPTPGGGGGGNGIGGNLMNTVTSSGPTANGGHHLSGAAFSPEGDLAFVGAEDAGVAVFDVRTAERCCVGECGYR